MDTSTIDLLSIVQRNVSLKKIGGKDGGEYAGPCPFCGGTDRFHVWPHRNGGGRFWCRQENQGGDAINYVMRLNGVTFKEAVAELGLLTDRPRQYRYERQRPAPPTQQRASESREWSALEDAEWQRCAWAFAEECVDNLYANKSAYQYLLGRGLNDTTIGVYWLGYNPADCKAKWGNTDVFLPAGWVIPWMYEGRIWRLNTRRAAGKDPKYLGVAGNANGLYNAALLKRDRPTVLVEGEFDCLAIMQAAGQLVTPVATGSNTGGRLQRWLAAIAQASQYIVAFDDDEAGESASKFWLDVLPGARRLVPKPHDPNDMLKSGGEQAIREWIQQAI